MKFTLKDYQADAVQEVLEELELAKALWDRDGVESSLALTAPTGAGKTVMAAAVIEALFYGSDTFDVEPDGGAVVIWFSDDPNLNDQTRTRLMDASEKFTSSDLVTIQYPFSRPKLEPGKVYFLNTGKLTKTSLLTRGHVDDDESNTLFEMTPDMQGYTIWETIANTITDPDLTLYLVLDEAHVGFDTKVTRDKPTIVRRLVQGHAGHPAVPVVWGISATITRFEDAMKAADETRGRRQLPPVSVEPGRVQESGLVKDVVSVKIPNEAGNFDTALVTLAAQELVASTIRWADYSTAQGLTDPVVPLLVLQTPNTPDPDEIGRALDTIADVYPDLYSGNVRHVFGEHGVQRFGAWDVEWIEPQNVQKSTAVRVLVAKDAISTGWDCPRAEVLVSFRPAKDNAHITQMLGRMVRNPLARSVPGDERLNSVECILPFFDRTTAGNVVRYLTGNLNEMPCPGRKVLLDGRELRPNPYLDPRVWDVWDALPTQKIPKRGVRPVKRLVSLALALASDGVRPGALTEAEDEMHAVLDGYAVRYRSLLDEQVSDVMRVDLQEILGEIGSAKMSYREFSVRADDRAIRSAFEEAKRAFGADIAQSYVNHLADAGDDGDDGLRDAYMRTAALAMIPEVREKVDQEANDLVTRWYAQHRVDIKSLSDLRQDEYTEIHSMTTDPWVDSLGRPRSRMEDFAEKAKDAEDAAFPAPAPLVELHLMSDEEGKFPLSSLNPWERRVVGIELERPGAIGWYRNPPRGATDSVAIAYRNDRGNWASLYPDFVFFHEINGQAHASIVDPHGHHLPDAAAKLKALADFAGQFGQHFHRIEAVSELEHSMYALDMTIPEVRDAVRNETKPPIEFYRSDLAIVFDQAGKSHRGRRRDGDQ